MERRRTAHGRIGAFLLVLLGVAAGAVPVRAGEAEAHGAAAVAAGEEMDPGCRTEDGRTTCVHLLPIRRGTNADAGALAGTASDAGRLPTIAELAARAPATGTPRDGDAATPGIACAGNGVDGHRVQALYLYVKVNRFAAVAPLIRRYAAQADTVFRASASMHGGPARRIRWVTTRTCQLTIIPVRITIAQQRSIPRLAKALAARGLDRADRLYLGWLDAPATTICGSAEDDGELSPDVTNDANSGPNVGKVFATCWGQSAESGNNGYESTEAHELMHMLGAVNREAPNATESGHCRDEWDLMCYAAEGDRHTFVRCGFAWANRFDCGGDDYFDPSPRKSSWLATHWNTANSSFLTGTDRAAPLSLHFVARLSQATSAGDLSWQVIEDQLIVRQVLEVRVDGGAWRAVADYGRLDLYPNYAAPVVRPGHVFEWRVRAMDSSGRWSPWVRSVRVTVPRTPGPAPL